MQEMGFSFHPPHSTSPTKGSQRTTMLLSFRRKDLDGESFLQPPDCFTKIEKIMAKKKPCWIASGACVVQVEVRRVNGITRCQRLGSKRVFKKVLRGFTSSVHFPLECVSPFTEPESENRVVHGMITQFNCVWKAPRQNALSPRVFGQNCLIIIMCISWWFFQNLPCFLCDFILTFNNLLVKRLRLSMPTVEITSAPKKCGMVLDCLLCLYINSIIKNCFPQWLTTSFRNDIDVSLCLKNRNGRGSIFNQANHDFPKITVVIGDPTRDPFRDN